MKKRLLALLLALLTLLGALTACGPAAGAPAGSEPPLVTGSPSPSPEPAEYDPAGDSSGFVSLAEAVPGVILEIRYYSTYNFVGDRIDGYEEPCALITKEAAAALSGAARDAAEQGYRLKIYDAYRPQSAVDHFIRWAEDTGDTRMKPYFYPELDKSVLFDQGYIAEKSGHSRGSTVDLTLFDMDTGKELDMGGTFDYFGELSHPDYTGALTREQIANRNILRDIMVENGFNPLDTEWWHFTLRDEPYPDTYFTFPVSGDSVSHTAGPIDPGPAPAPTEEPEGDDLPVYGEYYYDVASVVLYLEAYGELPPNYITKDEARDLGWSGGSVEKYKEGAAIGGDRFGNHEGLLPTAKGRSYTECDIDTLGYGSRGARRLIFSNDGLYFYTEDHYESFQQVTVEGGKVTW